MKRPQPKHSSPVSSELCLFLNESNNWTYARRCLPQLSETRLEQARNSKIGTEGNNDLMEFVGDRIANLVCALIVAKDSFCPDQQVIVDRAVSNNDTLGRLAYRLQLHQDARLDDRDSKDVANWDIRHHASPPKVLADLFEAYTGAVYEEHGWDVTKDWLGTLFKPLIEKATEDYLKQHRDTPRYPNRVVYVSHELLGNPVHQEKVHDYLEFRANKFITMADPALSALPQSTKFVFGANGDIGNDRDMVEIATHLVKFWVCEIFMVLYPENRKALLKGPHLVTSITTLVTNAWTLGYLGSLLKLGSFFDVDDPDFSLFDKRLKSPRSETAETKIREASLRSKLTQAVYAMIGWYHSQDATAARKWGIKWLTPLVIRAHDIVVEDPSFKPCLPHGANDTLALHAAALEAIQKNRSTATASKEDELEARFAAMVLRDKEIRGSRFGPEHATLRRLTIDLDDSDKDNSSDQDDETSGGKLSPVEGLIPTMQKPRIDSSQRSQTVDHIPANIKKKVNIAMHSSDASRFETRPPAAEPDAAGTKVIEEELSRDSLTENTYTQEQGSVPDSLGSNTPNPDIPSPVLPTHAHNNANDKRLPEDVPHEPKAIRNQTKPPSLPQHEVQAHTLPRNREPPREPRAMREQRNRAHLAVVPKPLKAKEEIKQSKGEEKEKGSRICSRG